MKRLIVVSFLVLAAFPAHAISRYNSMSMSCSAAQQLVLREGAVIRFEIITEQREAKSALPGK